MYKLKSYNEEAKHILTVYCALCAMSCPIAREDINPTASKPMFFKRLFHLKRNY